MEGNLQPGGYRRVPRDQYGHGQREWGWTTNSISVGGEGDGDGGMTREDGEWMNDRF